MPHGIFLLALLLYPIAAFLLLYQDHLSRQPEKKKTSSLTALLLRIWDLPVFSVFWMINISFVFCQGALNLQMTPFSMFDFLIYDSLVDYRLHFGFFLRCAVCLRFSTLSVVMRSFK